jgi:hypothetical protein
VPVDVNNKYVCDWCGKGLRFDLTSSLLITLSIRSEVVAPHSQQELGTFCSSICLQEYLDDYLKPNDSYGN